MKIHFNRIQSESGANPTILHEVLGGRIDTLQKESADIEDSYQSYVLGANDNELPNDSTDGDWLRQSAMKINLLRAYNRIAQSESITELKAAIKAGSEAFNELAQG